MFIKQRVGCLNNCCVTYRWNLSLPLIRRPTQAHRLAELIYRQPLLLCAPDNVPHSGRSRRYSFFKQLDLFALQCKIHIQTFELLFSASSSFTHAASKHPIRHTWPFIVNTSRTDKVLAPDFVDCKPASASFRIPTIRLFVNCDFFIRISTSRRGEAKPCSVNL